ncbi:MAG: hypothetical protein QS721_14630 [Candidatus Endonucleobacter sp. (ex Gigantidas childressi)]|nr:hypothetical protein [Candidatus Endonucleobacter sp. (ex Gigantidas childressi)]
MLVATRLYTRRLSNCYVVAAFAHPYHLLLLASRGFSYLLPSSNLKCFGYKQWCG